MIVQVFFRDCFRDFFRDLLQSSLNTARAPFEEDRKECEERKISPISREKKEKELRIQSNKEKEVAIFGGKKQNNSSNRQI
jgi:hypothetical protein